MRLRTGDGDSCGCGCGCGRDGQWREERSSLKEEGQGVKEEVLGAGQETPQVGRALSFCMSCRTQEAQVVLDRNYQR